MVAVVLQDKHDKKIIIKLFETVAQSDYFLSRDFIFHLVVDVIDNVKEMTLNTENPQF